MSEHDDRPHLIKKRARAIMAERLWRGLWMLVTALAIFLISVDVQQTLESRQEIARHNERMERLIVVAVLCSRDANDSAQSVQSCIDQMMTEGE